MNIIKHSDPIRELALRQFIKLCHIKTYPIKTTLIHAGEVNETLYYIIKGSVLVDAEDKHDKGKELILAYLNKGEFFGELGVFNNNEPIIVNVKTRCECKVAEITHKRVRNLLKKELPEHAADILFILGEQIADRLYMTSRNFRDLAFMDTKERITRTLLDLAKEPDAMTHPEGMQLYISRQEISRIVGCSREVVGRVLKELEEKKLITAHGKTIVVFGTR